MQSYLFAARGTDARALSRALLLYALTAARGVTRMPALARTQYGKPYFPDHPDLFFSYSHTRGVALCALMDRPHGVDIEVRRPLRADLPQRVLAPGERADHADASDKDARLLTYWTLRESYWKYVGTGMSAPLCAPEFRLERDGTARCVVPQITARYYIGNDWYAALCTADEPNLPVAPLWVAARALPAAD